MTWYRVHSDTTHPIKTLDAVRDIFLTPLWDSCGCGPVHNTQSSPSFSFSLSLSTSRSVCECVSLSVQTTMTQSITTVVFWLHSGLACTQGTCRRDDTHRDLHTFGTNYWERGQHICLTSLPLNTPTPTNTHQYTLLSQALWGRERDRLERTRRCSTQRRSC